MICCPLYFWRHQIFKFFEILLHLYKILYKKKSVCNVKIFWPTRFSLQRWHRRCSGLALPCDQMTKWTILSTHLNAIRRSDQLYIQKWSGEHVIMFFYFVVQTQEVLFLFICEQNMHNECVTGCNTFGFCKQKHCTCLFPCKAGERDSIMWGSTVKPGVNLLIYSELSTSCLNSHVEGTL